VPDGPGTFTSIPAGNIDLPGMPDHYLAPGIDTTDDGRVIFALEGEVQRLNVPVADAITAAARRIVAKDSLYRHKALRLKAPQPGAPVSIDFLDIADLDPSAAFFHPDVTAQLAHAVFTPIAHPEACAAAGVPRKRGILLHGAYGVGKSLTAAMVANRATAAGYTFILIEELDHLAEAYAFARAYGPAVVFAEDIDRATSGTRDSDMDAKLNAMDGIESKADDILTIWTSNNADAIHPAFRRPGRIDWEIEITAPDASTAAHMVLHYGAGTFSEALEEQDGIVAAAMDLAGQSPARIRGGSVCRPHPGISRARQTGRYSPDERCRYLGRGDRPRHARICFGYSRRPRQRPRQHFPA